MFFRRIAAHLGKLHWTAIAIDFVIVVLGVFVATQVSDWNSARLDRAEYGRALERLKAEVGANQATLDSVLPEITSALDTANRALDVLQSCKDSPENIEAVNAGLEVLRGTYTITLRRRALTDLTTNPTLLAQQSAAEREHFAELMDYLLLFEKEARFAEDHPLEERVEDDPMIRIGAARTVTYTYAGVEFTRVGRYMLLAAPVSRACHDDRLIKSFFTWTRFQSTVPAMAGPAKERLTAMQTFLTDRR